MLVLLASGMASSNEEVRYLFDESHPLKGGLGIHVRAKLKRIRSCMSSLRVSEALQERRQERARHVLLGAER